MGVGAGRRESFRRSQKHCGTVESSRRRRRPITFLTWIVLVLDIVPGAVVGAWLFTSLRGTRVSGLNFAQAARSCSGRGGGSIPVRPPQYDILAASRWLPVHADLNPGECHVRAVPRSAGGRATGGGSRASMALVRSMGLDDPWFICRNTSCPMILRVDAGDRITGGVCRRPKKELRCI